MHTSFIPPMLLAMFWPPARRPCQTPWCPSHRAVPATRELCYVCPALVTGGPGAWPPIAPRRWPAGGGPWCRRVGSWRPPLLAPCFGTCGCTGSGGKRHNFSLNFSQCVKGRRWCRWTREGLEGTRVFAGDAPCNREEIHRACARFYALQSVRT